MFLYTILILVAGVLPEPAESNEHGFLHVYRLINGYSYTDSNPCKW